MSLNATYILDFGLILMFVSRALKIVDLSDILNIWVQFKEDLLYPTVS